MPKAEANLRDLFLNQSKSWGNTITIHEGPSHYFKKHHLMSGFCWPETYHKQRFKTLYIEQGKGVLKYNSVLKAKKENIDLEPGVNIPLLPNDRYSIECYQDLVIFEVGTAIKPNDTFVVINKEELCL